MKYQKSSIPYLMLLATLLIGLPLTDHQIMKTQYIEIDVDAIEELPEMEFEIACNDDLLITYNLRVSQSEN